MTFLDYLLIDNIAGRNDPVLRKEEYRRAKENASLIFRHPLLFCLYIAFLIAACKFSSTPIKYFFLICSVWCITLMALRDNGIRRRINYILFPLGSACLAASVYLFFNKHKPIALLLFVAFIVFFYVIPLKVEAYAQKVLAKKTQRFAGLYRF